MRKIYSKPEILFEDFALSTNIAGDCDKIVGNHTKGTCGVIGSAPGTNLFIEDVSGCDFKNTADDYDGFCYHNPTEYNNLFNS